MDHSQYTRNYQTYGPNQQNTYMPYGSSNPSTTHDSTAQHVSRPSSTVNNAYYESYQQPQAQTQQVYNSNNQSWYNNQAATGDATHQVASTLTAMGEGTTYASRPAKQSATSNSYRRSSHTNYTDSQYQDVTSQQPQSSYNNAAATHAAHNAYSAQAYDQRQNDPQALAYSAQSTRTNRTASPLMHASNQRPASGQSYTTATAHTRKASAKRPASPAQVQASRQLQRMQAETRTQTGANSSHSQSRPNTQTSSAETYNPTTTINPTAVYDPWPEYQLKREAQAAKDARDAAARKIREDEEAAAKAAAEEQEREQERQRKKAEAADKKKERRKEKNQANKAVKKTDPPTAAVQGPPETDAEKEIREMMARIRELNSKHPSLLAKIWEQERHGYIQSQQETQSPQPGGIAAAAAAAAAASSSTPPVTPATPSVRTPKASTKSKARTTTPKQPAPPAPKPTATPALEPPSTRAPPAIPTFTDPQPTKQKGTIWPLEKKEQLSQVAAQFINNSAGNSPDTITPAAFHGILDRNPNYLELCEILEGMGIKLDRAAFARTLLNRVPDINQQRQANVGRKIELPQSASPSGAQASAPTSQWNSINRTPLPPSFDDALPSVDTGIDSTPAPSEPLTKAKAARKSINDLVDLLRDSDDDEPGPVLKGPPPRVEQTFNSAPAFNATQLLHDHANGARASTVPHSMESEVPIMPPPPAPIDLPPYLSRLQQKYSLALEEKCRHTEIVQPIEKSKVKRRTRYNPATIARDILLATGKHPYYAPLNSHLESLKASLQKLGRSGHRIDNNTDLSTIRWDMIDPGEPVPTAKVEPDVDASPRERDVRVPVKVHPEYLQYNKHSNADGDTPRKRVGRLPGSRMINGKMVAPDKFEAAKTEQMTKHNPNPDPNPAKRVNQTPVDETPAAKRQKTELSTPSSAPPQATLPGAMTPGSGYAALRAAQALSGGQPVKRRGRPVGWRKDLHMKSQPDKPSSIRNAAANDFPPTAAHPKNHPVLECKWSGCNAKLHNLDTLRKHIQKLHPTSDCRWGGCGRVVKQLNAESGMTENKHQFLRFNDAEAWFNHVEQSHIGPMSWSQGDGPQGVFSDGFGVRRSESYMLNRYGGQVTPRAIVSLDVQNMSIQGAKAIMRTQSFKSNRRVEIESAEEQETRRKRKLASEQDDIRAQIWHKSKKPKLELKP